MNLIKLKLSDASNVGLCKIKKTSVENVSTLLNSVHARNVHLCILLGMSFKTICKFQEEKLKFGRY
jgi:hypothetical protein